MPYGCGGISGPLKALFMTFVQFFWHPQFGDFSKLGHFRYLPGVQYALSKVISLNHVLVRILWRNSRLFLKVEDTDPIKSLIGVFFCSGRS